MKKREPGEAYWAKIEDAFAALNFALFGRWTLRDKAAQRPLSLNVNAQKEMG